jgi:hypothetical protein
MRPKMRSNMRPYVRSKVRPHDPYPSDIHQGDGNVTRMVSVIAPVLHVLGAQRGGTLIASRTSLYPYGLAWQRGC